MVSQYRATCPEFGLNVRLTCCATAVAVIDFHVCERPPASGVVTDPPAPPAQATKPLVSQRIAKPRVHVQGSPAAFTAPEVSLTPERVADQRQTRRAALRGGGRG